MSEVNKTKQKEKRTILSRFDGSKFHAGPKAKRDIETILAKDYGFTPVFFDVGTSKIAKVINAVKRIYDVWNESRKADLLAVQWPYSDKQLYTRTIQHPITWIHDIDYIRLQRPSLKDFELDFLKRSKVVVVHNEVMAKELIKEGIDPSKIVVLELFDYLVEGSVPKRSLEFCNNQGREEDHKNKNANKENDSDKKSNPNKKAFQYQPVLTYTGNLDKSEFIWQLRPEQMDYELNVYGSLDQKISNPKIHYKGTLPPDEVPNQAEGNIGLVWDGNLDDSDADAPNKNYTRYNNPHKLSCYLAAGLPVIVWRQTAVSRLVNKYNVGWIIDKLEDINVLDFSDYKEKQKNAAELGKKVRQGYFSHRAMDEVLKKLNLKPSQKK